MGREMAWFIKKVPGFLVYSMAPLMTWPKSSPLHEEEPIKLEFYYNARVDAEDELIHQTSLYHCNDAEAPKVRNNSESAPFCLFFLSYTITGTRTLCTMEVDLRKIPRRLFRKRSNSKGVEFYMISHTLSLTPTSTSLIFELEFEGISYGTVRADYV